MNQQSSYEVAIWRAKESPAKHKDTIVKTTNSGLGKLDGFVNRTILQSAKNPELLFDWVEWENTEAGINAAKNMMNIPELKEFVSLVEKTELFEHYTIQGKHTAKEEQGTVVEFVAYELKEGSDFTTFQKTYSKHIINFEGYHHRFFLRNTKNPNQWAEWVYWNSEESAQKATAEMMKIPEIGEVFQMVKEIQFEPQLWRVAFSN